jgi:phosphoribosylaminoimidazole-succinocarboxamide synthase
MILIGDVELAGIKKIKSGKVREMFSFENMLLIVTTDRISAFDYILLSLIPYKGAVLNSISNFWFDYLKDVISNHIIETDAEKFPENLKKYNSILKGRSALVRKAQIIPVECVVRGYITGSGWEEYKKTGGIGDIKLPVSLKMCDKLPEPVFTPTTKEDVGHDMLITERQAKNIYGESVIEFLKDKSLKLYTKASEYALKKGIIIADTKFEFGTIGDEIILVDEILTPDSSRFWPLEGYEPGRQQPSFDKQYVRDYLLSTDWNRNSIPPELPEDVIARTTERYIAAYEKLTGKKFEII